MRTKVADRIFVAMLCAGTVFLVVTALLQHRALGTGYDLGIYDQTVWNLARLRPFMTTLVYETGGYYDHFEPILLTIVPFYWLISDVRVLLVVQSLALSLGAVPIYLYARRRLATWEHGTLLALVIAAVYLIYPAMHNANLNDFHEVSLLPPLLGFALYGLLTGQRRVTLIFLGLCLMVKEDFSVTFLMFGLFILAFNPAGFRRRDGLWLAIGGAAWMLLVLYLFYPTMTHGMPYPFVQRRYPWLGDSPQSAATVLLTQPWIVIPYLIQTPKLLFLLRLLGPLLFLPLLGMPIILLSFPVLTYLMLSNYEPQWSVQSYYNPPLLPFLFFGLILALSHIRRWLGRAGWRGGGVAIAMMCIIAGAVSASYYLDAPGPGSKSLHCGAFQRDAAAWRPASAILAQISTGRVGQRDLGRWYRSFRSASASIRCWPRPVIPTDFLALEDTPGAEGAPLYPYARTAQCPTGLL